jgi:hypothetical protein
MSSEVLRSGLRTVRRRVKVAGGIIAGAAQALAGKWQAKSHNVQGPTW